MAVDLILDCIILTKITKNYIPKKRIDTKSYAICDIIKKVNGMKLGNNIFHLFVKLKNV